MIVRNFLWLSTAKVAVLAIALFTGVYARRVLGVTAIGQYAWCLAVLSYFSLLASPKITVIGLRDVAREPSLAARRYSQLLAIQFTLAIASFGLVCAFAAMGLRGPAISRLLILSAIALLLLPFDLTWLLQARERMSAWAISQVAVQILRLPALVLLVHEPADVARYAVLAYPFQLGSIGYFCWYVGRHGLLRWKDVRPSFRGAWPLLKEALPLGLSQSATFIYGNFDAILLGILGGDKTVGIYTTAYSLMLTPTFLAEALTQAYFPHLSRVRDDGRQTEIVSADFLKIHVWIGMLFAALGWAFGRYVIVFLYGASFVHSGPLLEWLSLDLALIFLSGGIGQPLNAWGLQRPYFLATLSGAAANVALNLVLIPVFGAGGAVATTLLAEGAVGVGCLWIRQRHVRIPWRRIAARPALVCLTAAVIGKYLAGAFPHQWPIWATLVACGVTAGFWVSERRGLPALLRRLRGGAHAAGP